MTVSQSLINRRSILIMTEANSVESLLILLQSTVDGVLSYLEGPGSASDARIGEWGAWEVLAHFLYWHEMTAVGMESVSKGTGPVSITGETDATNARSVDALKGNSFLELGTTARELHKRLDAAARQMRDIGEVVMIRPEAPEGQTGRQRLERLILHWNGHTEELRAQS